VKDLYIAEYDRIRNKLVDAGCPDDLAEEIASERAYPAMRDRLADMADDARMRAKEERR
jgi:hypothetical protein